MNNAPKVIAMNGALPQLGSAARQAEELVEVMATLEAAVLRLQRANPDSASLQAARKHSQKLLRALSRYRAAFVFDELPF